MVHSFGLKILFIGSLVIHSWELKIKSSESIHSFSLKINLL